MNTFPSCQDFELAVNCLPSTCTSVLACTSTSLTPVGWENSTADGTGNWSVDEGGTSSTATGPGTGAGTGQSDYVPGTTTGNYVYMESGSCTGNTIIANSPVYDVRSFANPNVRVQMAYNMYGATMGTMAIDIEDPAPDEHLDPVVEPERRPGPGLVPDPDAGPCLHGHPGALPLGSRTSRAAASPATWPSTTSA